MNKSYVNIQPRTEYSSNHSTPLNQHVEELIEVSLEHPLGIMTGARGVLQTCSTIIEMIQAKNVLDVGLFTGVSALTWATVLPSDGKVISMDIDIGTYNTVGRPFVDKAGVGHKIDIRIQPAEKTLQELIDAGQTGKFDFAFIDCNKIQYPDYYSLCLQLLRPGGVLAVDNAFYLDTVFLKEKEALTMSVDKINELVVSNPELRHSLMPIKKSVMAIDKLNKTILSNPTVRNVLLPIEDGLHIVLKK